MTESDLERNLRSNTMNYKQLSKYLNEIQKYMHTCKCGHRVLVSNGYTYNICNWCGRKVYRSEQDEFKEKMQRRLKSERKNLGGMQYSKLGSN